MTSMQEQASASRDNLELFPICAKCNKLVDRIVRREDINMDALVFEAHCHGEVDRTIITGVDEMEWGPYDLSRGVAFRDDATKRIDVIC